MTTIKDFSEEELKKKLYIKNYSRSTSHGVTKVKYVVVKRLKTALIGGSITAAAVGLLGSGLVIAISPKNDRLTAIGKTLLGTALSAVVGGFGGCAIGATSEQECFADEDGKILGYDCNSAAERANELGDEMLTQNNFIKAIDWFNKAYHTCTDDYPKKQNFLDKKNLAIIDGNIVQ